MSILLNWSTGTVRRVATQAHANHQARHLVGAALHGKTPAGRYTPRYAHAAPGNVGAAAALAHLELECGADRESAQTAKTKEKAKDQAKESAKVKVRGRRRSTKGGLALLTLL